MAKGISDLGNGYGYLYETDIAGTTILTADRNTVDGARNMKRMAVANAPISANRSAVATITVTGCASVGNITQILINGVNQLGAALAVSTSVNATLAALIAAAINAFTPGSGSKQTAYSIGDVVYILTPPEFGSALNGQAITVSVSDVSITTTTTTFVNGSSAEGVYDTSLGRRYWINADYGAAGIVGSATATATSITYAFEITEWMTQRGSQTGTPVLNVTIASDNITGTNRYNSKMIYVVETQGSAAADVLAQLNPEDFLEGDQVIIRGYDPTHVVTVESAPVTTSAAPTPNIYLIDDLPFICDSRTKALTLIYHYDNSLGAIFIETGRSDTPGGPIDPGSGDGFSLLIGKSLFVSKTGDDALAARQDLKYHYLTIVAALADAISGDTVVVYPGLYQETNFIKDGVTLHLMPGAQIQGLTSGAATISLASAITAKITGFGDILAFDQWAVTQNNASSILSIDCNKIVGSPTATELTVAILTGSKTYINCHEPISPGLAKGAVEVRGAGDVFIQSDMIDPSTSDLDRATTDCRMLGIYDRSGVNPVVIKGTIIGRQKGPTVDIQASSLATGIISIKGDIINKYSSAAAQQTSGIGVAAIGPSAEAPTVFIEGNIIVYGQCAGVVAGSNTSSGKMVIRGNIYSEYGSCIANASSGVAIRIIGDCYQSSQFSANSAIVVGQDDAANSRYQGGRVEINGRVKSLNQIAPACIIDVSAGLWPTLSGLFFDSGTIISDVPATAPCIDTMGNAENLYSNSLVVNRSIDLNGGAYIGGTPIVDYNYI